MYSAHYRFIAAAAFAVAIAPALAAQPAMDTASGFPSRPLRMIVPFTPSGPND